MQNIIKVQGLALVLISGIYFGYEEGVVRSLRAYIYLYE